MAGLTRLELATFRVTGERSNQTELQPQWDNFLSNCLSDEALAKSEATTPNWDILN